MIPSHAMTLPTMLTMPICHAENWSPSTRKFIQAAFVSWRALYTYTNVIGCQTARSCTVSNRS